MNKDDQDLFGPREESLLRDREVFHLPCGFGDFLPPLFMNNGEPVTGRLSQDRTASIAFFEEEHVCFIA